MKPLSHLLISLIGASAIAGSALLAVQNATPISLSVVGITLVPIPLGLLLALGFGVGLGLGAIAPLAWQLLGPSKSR